MCRRADDTPLWPVVLAFGLVAIATLFAVGVVIERSVAGEAEVKPGPLAPLRVVRAVRHGARAVRVVTTTGGCERPVNAEVELRADVVIVRILGQNPGGGCTAETSRDRRLRGMTTVYRRVAGSQAVDHLRASQLFISTLNQIIDANSRITHIGLG